MNRLRHPLLAAIGLVLAGCKDRDPTLSIRNDLPVIELASVTYHGRTLFSSIRGGSSSQFDMSDDWRRDYCGLSEPLIIELKGPLGKAQVTTVAKYTFPEGQDQNIVIDDSTRFYNH